MTTPQSPRHWRLRVWRIAGPGITRGAAHAVVFLFAFAAVIGALNLLFTVHVADQQHAQITSCQLHAVQKFDAAIGARTRAGSLSTAALQNLIGTVFTPHGSAAQERAADLAAYARWRAAVTAQQHIRLPPLPETACG